MGTSNYGAGFRGGRGRGFRGGFRGGSRGGSVKYNDNQDNRSYYSQSLKSGFRGGRGRGRGGKQPKQPNPEGGYFGKCKIITFNFTRSL